MVVIPVYQTRTVANDGCGNCFAACVASILELRLSEVCAVSPKDETFWPQWEEWLTDRGLELDYERADDAPPKGYSIGQGYGDRIYPEGHSMAGRPIAHAAVMFNGVLVHDPYPLKGGFERVKGYWTIRATEKAAA